MKRTMLLFIFATITTLACQLSQIVPALPTGLPAVIPLLASPTSTLTPTSTPTPTPPPTPTPLPEARIGTGDHALFNGDLDAAMIEFNLARQLSPDPEIQAAALAGIGRTYFEMGEYAAALDPLRTLLETFPESVHRPEAYYYLAITYEELSRWLDAADAYQGYLTYRPGVLDAFIHERRGDALFSTGDYAGALLDYQAALNSPHLDVNFPLEVKLARSYALTGDAATALIMFEDIQNRSSAEYIKAQTDYLKGQTYMAQGQPDLAYAAYMHAVENYPSSYDAYLALVELVTAGYPVNELQRGIVDYYAGECVVAIAAFDRYLASGSSSDAAYDPATAYYFRGMCLQSLDESAAAIDTWDQVIISYPGSAVWDRAWEMKAYTQWAYLDQYVAGRETLTSFVASVPTHPRAAEFLFDAAVVAERNDELALAAQLWERTAAEYPGSSYTFRALFLAGIAEYRLADYLAAQATFLRAQASAGEIADRAAATLWIGKTYQALGDTTTAQSIWQQAILIDPTGYYSERARELISGRPPLSDPQNFDLGMDIQAERQQAEAWLRTTFVLPEGTVLSGLGELAGDARYVRGLEFWRLGEYTLASAEFDALRMAVQDNPGSSYRLATALVELGAYRPAILASRQVLTLAGLDDAASLNAPIYFNHIRFGTYFSDLVIPLASQYNFHPLFLWSVMRQESLFERGIRSSAGAQGLMQIMPPTGQEIAERMGWPPNFTPSDLNRPAVSIRMGLDYLSDQRVYLGGDMYAALAAYNGGPGNAATWQFLSGGDPDLFLEIIRFEETRRYIKAIYEIYSIYRRLYERTP